MPEPYSIIGGGTSGTASGYEVSASRQPSKCFNDPKWRPAIMEWLKRSGFETDKNPAYYTRHLKESDLYITICVDECDSIEALWSVIDKRIAAAITDRDDGIDND